MNVLGRTSDDGPVAEVGAFRARDGSAGAPVGVDIDGPHVGLVVGKRGYGKSYTLGVLAEELARGKGTAPVLFDPMGAFRTIVDGSDGTPVPAQVIDQPRIRAGAIPPRSWCTLLDLEPKSAPGALVWRAATDADTLEGMRRSVHDSDASRDAIRAALNHLELAASWEAFAADGLDATTLSGTELTVLDCSGLDDAAINAVGLAVARALYDARIQADVDRLPWLLVDEAHALFDGAAEPALRTILTRGRQPGVSLVAATQRPGALPDVAISQADVIVAHRLTARSDRNALERVAPSYMGGTIAERMPTTPGEALLVDDVTEQVHTVSIRERDTPHGGSSPKASAVEATDGGDPATEVTSIHRVQRAATSNRKTSDRQPCSLGR